MKSLVLLLKKSHLLEKLLGGKRKEKEVFGWEKQEHDITEIFCGLFFVDWFLNLLLKTSRKRLTQEFGRK